MFVDQELTRKTAQLVRDKTYGGAIQETLEVYEINEGLLERLAQDDRPDTVKIFNLKKTIENMVKMHGRLAPYLLSIGERAQAIIDAYQARQQETQEALQALSELIEEINQAERERVAKALDPTTFAVYWLLKGEDLQDPEGLARQMEATFTKYPHWRLGGQQEREVRREVWASLIKARSANKDGAHSVKEDLEALKRSVEQVLRVAYVAAEEA